MAGRRQQWWLVAAVAAATAAAADINALAPCSPTPERNVTMACTKAGVYDVLVPPNVERVVLGLFGAGGGYTMMNGATTSAGGTGMYYNTGANLPKGTVWVRLAVGAGGVGGCTNGNGVGGGGGGGTTIAALDAQNATLALLAGAGGGGGAGCCPGNQSPLWASLGLRDGGSYWQSVTGPYMATAGGADGVGGVAALRPPAGGSPPYANTYLWAAAPYNVSAASNGTNANGLGPVSGGAGGVSAGLRCGGGGGGGYAGGAGGASAWTPYGKCCGAGGTSGSAWYYNATYVSGGLLAPAVSGQPGFYNATANGLNGTDGGIYFNFEGVAGITRVSAGPWPQVGGGIVSLVGSNFVDVTNVQLVLTSNSSIKYEGIITGPVNYTNLQFVAPPVDFDGYYFIYAIFRPKYFAGFGGYQGPGSAMAPAYYTTYAPSPTGTPSHSPSPSVTLTGTATASVTVSSTVSPTQTATTSESPSVTTSESPSVTASESPSVTASETGTPPVTASVSASATDSATASATHSAAPTAAVTPATTPSETAAATTAGTPMATAATTASGTAEGTPTATPPAVGMAAATSPVSRVNLFAAALSLGLLSVACICCLFCLCFRKKSRRREQQQQHKEAPPAPPQLVGLGPVATSVAQDPGILLLTLNPVAIDDVADAKSPLPAVAATAPAATAPLPATATAAAGAVAHEDAENPI